MRGCAAVVLVLILSGALLGQQAPASSTEPTSDEESLHRAEMHMMGAAMENDAAAFAALTDPAYRTVNEDGSAGDLRETLAEIRSPYHLQMSSEPVTSENQLRVIGDTGLISGRWKFMTSENKELDIRYLEVWVKRNGEWKFAQWQATRVTPEGLEREKRMKELAAAGK